MFAVDKYLTLSLSGSERSALAQTRCGILPLYVENSRLLIRNYKKELVKSAIVISLKINVIFCFNTLLMIYLRIS